MLTVSTPVAIAAIGDVTPDFGTLDGVDQLDDQSALIRFTVPPGEISGFELGGLDLGTNNWKLSVDGLLPTQSFTLALTPTAVPLPHAVSLLATALAVLGALRRRARNLR
jgi:hypothetical protein